MNIFINSLVKHISHFTLLKTLYLLTSIQLVQTKSETITIPSPKIDKLEHNN